MTSSPRSLDDAAAVPLPEGPTHASLEPALREAIGRAWIEHAASERAEAASLSQVAAIVLERSAPPDLHWLAVRAAADELRHAALCVRVARAYDPAHTALPRARVFAPTAVTVPAEHATSLRVLAQYCVQEALAAAYLERAYADAREPLPRAVLRLLLGDEIDHGRIGYAFAATLSERERAALRAPLAVLIDRCVDTWRSRARALPALSSPEHGVLAASTIERTIEEAVATLILPGLRDVGLAR